MNNIAKCIVMSIPNLEWRWSLKREMSTFFLEGEQYKEWGSFILIGYTGKTREGGLLQTHEQNWPPSS